MLAYSPSIAAVKIGDRSRLAMGEAVTGNYFQLLGVSALRRPDLLPEDDRPRRGAGAVISLSLWTARFGASPSASARRSAFTASRTRSSA